MRGQPLAVRLALLLAAVVVVVLLVAGVVVNRAASRSLHDAIGPREQQRIGLAATVIEQGLERGIGERGMRALLQRIARDAGGSVRLIGPDGAVRFEAGRLPADAETESVTTDLSTDAGGGSLQIEVPSAARGFLGAFNRALVLTGIVAVVALLVAAALVANRLTAPLRGVALAARRLGAGDLAARAQGGADAESTELAAAFNGMADRLERSEQLRQRAASDLAHDLATPATVLESQLQAMVDGVVPADIAQLEKARAAASGLSSVIGQLGELTQAEAAPLQRDVVRVDLGDLARATVDSLHGLLREGDVRATVSGPDGVATEADRGQLARALRNVVSNAIQHSPAGADVRIETGDRPPSVRVTDTGPGIDPEDLPFVFERFYRADRSRGRAGSGIGLTVARELIAANGGSISVEATGPEGTTFVISFG